MRDCFKVINVVTRVVRVVMRGRHKVATSCNKGCHKTFTKMVSVVKMSSPSVVRVVKMSSPKVVRVSMRYERSSGESEN